jgi:2-polyprenyl-3-methyl-5-hydroxy-6-metoxy-1,4-benzoquinol methylase
LAYPACFESSQKKIERSKVPFSYSSQLSTIVGYADQFKPASVLDVGAGMGVYGFLLRNFLENVNLFEVQGDKGWQRPREQWKVRIDGIEGFEGYRTPVHDYAYNRLIVGDALEVLTTLPSKSYELVMAIDILEHFDKPLANDFIDECCRVCSGALLVSTPKVFMHQEVAANPYENHRSHWSRDELSSMGFTTFLEDPLSWIAVNR